MGRISVALLVISILAVSTVAFAGSLKAILFASNPQAGAADFSIFAFPQSLTIPQGSSGTSTILLSSVNGFQGTVNLVTSSFCSSGSCPTLTVNPSSVSVPSNGNASSTLTIATTAITTVATYTATVFGSSSSLSHSVNVNFNVVAPPKPDFSISANPRAQTFPPGFNATSTLLLTSLNGFSGTIGLSTPLVACGTYCWSVRPTSVNLTHGGTNSSTLIFFSTTSTKPGNYTVPVQASSGGLSHQVVVTFTVASSATPDFSMTANPSSQIARVGVSATSTIVVSSINGFSGTVGFTLPVTCLAIGCPVWSINPSSVNLMPGGNANSTLKATFYQPANYSVRVTGTSGNLTHAVNVFFVVVSSSGAPDFAMSATPASLQIVAGTSGTSTITVASLNGFSGVVSLSTSPSPACPSPGCSTWSITPSSVTLKTNGTATATLTIFAGTLFPGPGKSATVTVYGNSGSLNHSVSVVFTTVSSTPNFTISASPMSQTVPQGSTATSKILLSSVNNFSGTISLSTSPPPLCVSCPNWGVSPSSVTLVPGGTATSTLTFSTTLATPTTNWFVTVFGTSGGLSHNVTVTFTVVPSSPTPDFAMSANPSSLRIPAGTTATSTITLTSLGGFSGNVSLSTSPSPLCPAPACSTWSVNPTVVGLGPNGSATATLSIFGGTGGGNGTITVSGKSGSLSHSVNVMFTVIASNGDFSLKANPAALGIAQGSCQTSTITVTSVNNFNGTVSLAAASSTSALSVTISPSAVSVPPGGSATSTLTVCSSRSTPTGSYNVTVTGKSGSLSHSINIPITITSPNFLLSASPTNMTITAGSSGMSVVNVTSINNFAGTVNLSTTVSASGPTTNLNPSNITLNAGGTANSILTVSTTASTPPGFYIVTVIGNGSSINKSHTFQVGVTVTAAAKQDFAIAANPMQVTVPVGSTGFSTITVGAINGFSGTVFFSPSSSPGLLANISPHNVTGSGSATLTVSASAAGRYNSTVTGTSGSLTHSVTVIVNVTVPPPTPDFTITASPSSQSVARGSSTSFTITVRGTNGFNGTVSLKTTISPITNHGPTTSLPSTVGPYSNSTLTISTARNTPTGTYTITITATSASLTHTVTVTVTVTR